MGYNVACNPIGTVPNALLSSAPGKELHPLTLSMIDMHGGQVKIYRQKVYHYVERIWIILVTPIFCITYTIVKKYHPGEPVNIHTESLINIIQEKNRAIKTKKGKGKLPLFFVNGEQVITIYGGSSVFLWGTARPKRDGLRRRWKLGQRGEAPVGIFNIVPTDDL